MLKGGLLLVGAGAWHMKLRTKKGFVNLNLVDSTGQQYTINPDDDPFLHKSQVSPWQALSPVHPSLSINRGAARLTDICGCANRVTTS